MLIGKTPCEKDNCNRSRLSALYRCLLLRDSLPAPVLFLNELYSYYISVSSAIIKASITPSLQSKDNSPVTHKVSCFIISGMRGSVENPQWKKTDDTLVSCLNGLQNIRKRLT